MTEEEINKKAEKHCNEVLCNAHEKCNEVIKCRDWRSRRAGFFCGYEQALKDFEKENAELKKQLEMSNKVYNDNLDYSHHIEGQLTKAKELLERLLITSCNSDVLNLLPNCSEVLRVRIEAEQFISLEKELSSQLKEKRYGEKFMTNTEGLAID